MKRSMPLVLECQRVAPPWDGKSAISVRASSRAAGTKIFGSKALALTTNSTHAPCRCTKYGENWVRSSPP